MSMSDTPVVDAIEAIIVAGVAMTNRALSQAREGHELTFPQWRVLVILVDPAGLPVNEIARLIGVTLPATGRQLRRLEQRGLVRLVPDGNDRRVTRAILTDAGHAVRAAIISDRRMRIEEALSGLSIDRRLAREMANVAAALDRDRIDQRSAPPRGSASRTSSRSVE
jgi:DNA-binding MarR family transcriptional regulator